MGDVRTNVSLAVAKVKIEKEVIGEAQREVRFVALMDIRLLKNAELEP